MTNDEAPLSVYRMTGDDLVEEYQYLYDRFDRHTPNQKARFYYVNGEMKARGLEHGMPTPAARERYCQDLWMRVFQATSVSLDSSGSAGEMSMGRSSSLPLWNTAPARTSATRWGALTARQRACAASISL